MHWSLNPREGALGLIWYSGWASEAVWTLLETRRIPYPCQESNPTRPRSLDNMLTEVTRFININTHLTENPYTEFIEILATVWNWLKIISNIQILISWCSTHELYCPRITQSFDIFIFITWNLSEALNGNVPLSAWEYRLKMNIILTQISGNRVIGKRREGQELIVKYKVWIYIYMALFI